MDFHLSSHLHSGTGASVGITKALNLSSFSGSGAYLRVFTKALLPSSLCTYFGISRFSTLSVDDYWPGLHVFAGFAVLPICFLFAGILNVIQVGRSVSVSLCSADWRALRPGHTQAASHQKNKAKPNNKQQANKKHLQQQDKHLRVHGSETGATLRPCSFGVVREDPSTKVPSKVWTLQAFNEGPLPGAEGGGGAEGRFDLQRCRPSKVPSKGPSKVPSKGPSKGTFKGTFEGSGPSKVPSKGRDLRRYLRRCRYLCVKYVPKQSMP